MESEFAAREKTGVEVSASMLLPYAHTLTSIFSCLLTRKEQMALTSCLDRSRSHSVVLCIWFWFSRKS